MTFISARQTITDLRNAIYILQAEQWQQGDDFDISSNGVRYFCAFGAIRMAVGDIDVAHPERFSLTDESRDRASNASRAFYRVIGSDIATYNDVEGRTKQQMIRAMETVASAIEENPNRA